MERHAFDGISFFFGLIFVTVASWVLLTDGRLDFVDARWVWPVLLVAGGVALLVPTVRRNAPAALAVPTPGGAPTGDPQLEATKAELPPDPFAGER